MAKLRDSKNGASKPKPTPLELELFGEDSGPMDVEDEEDDPHLMLKWEAEQEAAGRWLQNEFAVLRALDLRGVDRWAEEVEPQERANFLQTTLRIPREASLQHKVQMVMALARFIEKHNAANCPVEWKLYYPQRVASGANDSGVDDGDADDEEDIVVARSKKKKTTNKSTKMARSKSKATKITKTKVTKAKKTNTTTALSQGNKGTKVALVARGWTDIPRPDDEGDWEAALDACKQPRKERNRLAPYFFSCRGVLYSNVIRPMLNWRDEAGRLKITKEQAKGIWSTSRGKYEAFVADDTGVGLVANKRGNEGRSTVQTGQKPVRKSDGRFESWPQAKEGRQAKATNLVPQRKVE